MPSIMLYVLCACPLDVGIVYVFLCSVFPPSMQRGYIMNSLSALIVILLTSNLPSALCLLGEGLRGPPPCIRYTWPCPLAFVLPTLALLAYITPAACHLAFGSRMLHPRPPDTCRYTWPRRLAFVLPTPALSAYITPAARGPCPLASCDGGLLIRERDPRFETNVVSRGW